MYIEDSTTNGKIFTSNIAELYKEQIKEFKNPQYFTISPDPRRYDNLKQFLDEWTAHIRSALYNVCNDYIYTIELAGSIRPHFHGIADIKDKVGFTQKMFIMSKYDNVKLHKPFKQGDDYLFKEIDDTFKLINRCPIREKGDDTDYKNKVKEERKREMLQRKREHFPLEIGLPKWMTDGNESE